MRAAATICILLMAGCLQGPQVTGTVEAPTWAIGDWWTFEIGDKTWTMQMVGWSGDAGVLARAPGSGPVAPTKVTSLVAVHPDSLREAQDWDRGSRTESLGGFLKGPAEPRGLELAQFPMRAGDSWDLDWHEGFLYWTTARYHATLEVSQASAAKIDEGRHAVLRIESTDATDNLGERRVDGGHLRLDYAPDLQMFAGGDVPGWAGTFGAGWLLPETTSGSFRMTGHGHVDEVRDVAAWLAASLPAQGPAWTPLEEPWTIRSTPGPVELEMAACWTEFPGELRWNSFDNAGLLARTEAGFTVNLDCPESREVRFKKEMPWPGVADLVLSEQDEHGRIVTTREFRAPLVLQIRQTSQCLMDGPCVLATFDMVPGTVTVDLSGSVAAPDAATPLEVVVTSAGAEAARQAWRGTPLTFPATDGAPWVVNLESAAPVRYTVDLVATPDMPGPRSSGAP